MEGMDTVDNIRPSHSGPSVQDNEIAKRRATTSSSAESTE